MKINTLIEYLSLKLKNNLTSDDINLLANFEENNKDIIEKYKRKIQNNSNNESLVQNKLATDYFDKLNNYVEKPYIKTLDDFFNVFMYEYKIINNKEFILNNSTKQDIVTIMLYFLKDERFLMQKNVLSEIKTEIGIKINLVKSLDKGLLIIGNYGVGKSSILLTISKILSNYNVLDNKPLLYKNSLKLVSEFESIDIDKSVFWDKYSNGLSQLLIDDVKREPIALKFGKFNVIERMIINNYESESTIFITCNFDDNYNYDVYRAILEFSSKYGGGYILSRIYEMFNIVVFDNIKDFRNGGSR